MSDVEALHARLVEWGEGGLVCAVLDECEGGACGTLLLTSFAQGLELRLSVGTRDGRYLELYNNRLLRVVGEPILRGGTAGMPI